MIELVLLNKMKNVYLIGGTMGVGKTKTGMALNEKLPNSIFLDGDWCWYSNPFKVTSETREMVLDNITHLINNYIKCSEFDNIIFCWVMHEQSIIDNLIKRLDLDDCNLKIISLICSKEELKKRLLKDLKKGIRNKECIKDSINRLSLYNDINSIKIDTTNLDINGVSDAIIKL